MISTLKQGDYFQPMDDLKHAIHIIGCGAIGSTLATMLVRMGVPKIYLYDFDIVEMKNICNQEYFDEQVGLEKTKSLTQTLQLINPSVNIIEKEKWEPGTRLSGYVFICVDNIELRKQIVEDNTHNNYVKAMFDFRMRLTDAQHYAADFKHLDYLISTMQFTHDEAKAETPVSACGTDLNVITTVRTICSLGLTNFINFVKRKELKKMVVVDLDKFEILAF